jgi:hypothetical protein
MPEIPETAFDKAAAPSHTNAVQGTNTDAVFGWSSSY